MKISKDTIVIALTIVIAVGTGIWAIRDAISASEERIERRLGARMDRMGVRMDGMQESISELQVTVNTLVLEARSNRKQIAHHHHRTDGEVYYTSSIASADCTGSAHLGLGLVCLHEFASVLKRCIEVKGVVGSAAVVVV